MTDNLDAAIIAHDLAIAAAGLPVWLGAEPTFTNAASHSPEWKVSALGPEKEGYSRRFLQVLANDAANGVVLRTLGRQYPGETKPRWSYGLYSRRDGGGVWTGPRDPIADSNNNVAATIDGASAAGTESVSRTTLSETRLSEVTVSSVSSTPDVDLFISLALELRTAIGFALQTAEQHIHIDLPVDAWGVRLLFSKDASLLDGDWHNDRRVLRPPLHSVAIPEEGWKDELAAAGIYVLLIGPTDSQFVCDANCLQVELPAFADVEQWLRFLELLATSAQSIGLKSLILTGCPPPVNASVAWTTVTPDPGVVEVNMAPCPTATEFLSEHRKLHAAAASVGLMPYQLMFNGEVVDSGGGQHLTFGGRTPDASPFLIEPHLLPRLIACLNRHPAISYWFAVRAVGSCGQQPRADEVSPESFDGLALALARLFQRNNIEPELLWRSVAPFLCDRFGNTHRCEINVEKLWNTLDPERGCLGLVELRAFRMTRSAEDATAVAVFLRTLLAWLAGREDKPVLIEWGSRLHDRFSLPFYLRQDLNAVLSKMHESGFPLDESVTSRLLDDSLLIIGEHDLGGATLIVRQAIEFWPVVGDLSAQHRTFRLMDSSTQRVEISLSVPKKIPAHASATTAVAWRLTLWGRDVPWVVEDEADRTVCLRGVRYKAFHPQMAVSPLVDAIDPLEFFLTSPDAAQTWRVRLFNWRPDGMAYDGCPRDFDEAQHRRAERLLVERIEESPASIAIAPSDLTEYSIDLRRIERTL